MLQLKAEDQLVFTNADKGLGICAMKLPIYIGWCLKHLKDTTTYTLITKEQAWQDTYKLKEEILEWTSKYHKVIGRDAASYIQEGTHKNFKDPFAYFYVMPKIHKAGPMGNKTRPVSSSCGCLNHPISEWLNEILLPLAAKQKLYVKISYEFKKI